MNERYSYSSQQFLTGNLDWLSDTFKVCLVNTPLYTFLKDTHHSLADVPAAARVATSPALANKTATNGVALADNVTVPNVSGLIIGALIIYHDTGVELTSTLVAYLDTLHGLPINPQGLSVTIDWSTTPFGIFKL
jgi:hypothetical protein